LFTARHLVSVVRACRAMRSRRPRKHLQRTAQISTRVAVVGRPPPAAPGRGTGRRSGLAGLRRARRSRSALWKSSDMVAIAVGSRATEAVQRSILKRRDRIESMKWHLLWNECPLLTNEGRGIANWSWELGASLRSKLAISLLFLLRWEATAVPKPKKDLAFSSFVVTESWPADGFTHYSNWNRLLLLGFVQPLPARTIWEG